MPNDLGVKKGSENYDLSLANYYSQMRAAIVLRGETAKLLKETGVTMARLAEAWVVGPNQACNTYQKLYDRKAYNDKSRAERYTGFHQSRESVTVTEILMTSHGNRSR